MLSMGKVPGSIPDTKRKRGIVRHKYISIDYHRNEVSKPFHWGEDKKSQCLLRFSALAAFWSALLPEGLV